MIKSDAMGSRTDRKTSERDKMCFGLDSNTHNNVLDDKGVPVGVEGKWEQGGRVRFEIRGECLTEEIWSQVYEDEGLTYPEGQFFRKDSIC
jgi:hypothetical protein